MANLELSVVAPDREVLSTSVETVMMPGLTGYFGVLPGHEPVVVALKPGIVEYVSADHGRHFVAVSGGFAQVNSEKVTILADAAEISTEVDASKAEAELEEARKALRGESSSMTAEQATSALEYASQRLRASRSKN